jgi:hypothetical protein
MPVDGFVDATLVRLADPGALKDLVFPAGDATGTRVRALLAEVFDLPFASVHDVLSVDVSAIECEVPLYDTRAVTGNWTQTIPANKRTEVQYEASDGTPLCWVEVTAELLVTVVLAIDPGEVESVRFTEGDPFITLHGEVRLKPVPDFDPTDPANQRRYRIRLAVLVRDEVDAAAALRDVRTVLAAAQRSVPYRRAVDDAAEGRAPWAPLVLFPAAGVPANGLTQDQLIQFFASQRVLAVFQTP